MLGRTLLLVWLILAAITAPGLGTATRAADRPADAALDLPAMVPTTDDLAAEGLEGFASVAVGGVTSSGWVSLGDAALDSVAGYSQHTQAAGGELVFRLDQSGWRRQYRLLLADPVPGDPSHISRSVALEVAEYADANGADAALTLLTTLGGSGDAREVPGTVSVGDRSSVLRDTTRDYQPRLVLMFRVGRLLASITVVERQTKEDPELAPVEAVAHRFQQRIADKLADPKPGLSSLAVRLSTPVHPAEFDEYWKKDGKIIAGFGESAADLAARAASYGNATDVYGLQNNLLPAPDQTTSPYVGNRLLGFPDEHTAAAWLADTPRSLADRAAGSNGTFGAEPIPDARPFGDESLTYAVKYEDQSAKSSGHRIYVRVGAVVAWLQIDGAVEPPLAAVEQLAAAQTACLNAGACPDAVPVPSILPGAYCPAAQQQAASDPNEPLARLGASALGSSVPMRGGDPARGGTHPGPSPAGEPAERWHDATRGGVKEMPVVADGGVYIGDEDSHANVTALDAATGGQRWCTTVGSLIHTTIVAADLIVLGVFPEDSPSMTESFIVALDRATGVERWRYALNGSITDLAFADGTVYAGSLDGGVLALDAATGKGRWRFQADLEPDTTSTVEALAVAGGTVYANAATTLYAVDAKTGDEVWRDTAPNKDSDFGSSSPTVAGGVVYIHAGDGIHGFDAQTGAERWRFAADGTEGGIAVADGVLYLSARTRLDVDKYSTTLYAVDLNTAQELWRYQSAGYVSDPAVVDGVLYVGTWVRHEDLKYEGAVVALDGATGKVLWSQPTAAAATAPAVIGGLVYVGSSGNTGDTGFLYAFGSSKG
jgi:outer membrane protein assembly factor BamB